jgi:hypothetical protein
MIVFILPQRTQRITQSTQRLTILLLLLKQYLVVGKTHFSYDGESNTS